MGKLIRNGIVKLDWDADLFYEGPNGEFCGAISMIDGSPILYRDMDAFIISDGKGGVATVEQIESILRELWDGEGDLTLSQDFDEAISLYNGGTHLDDDVVHQWGLTPEQCQEIEDRVMDLYPYYKVELTDDPSEAF